MLVYLCEVYKIMKQTKLMMARKLAGFSRNEASKILNISILTLYRYEYNKTSPTIETLKKASQLYKLPITYFIE